MTVKFPKVSMAVSGVVLSMSFSKRHLNRSLDKLFLSFVQPVIERDNDV